MSTPIHHEHLSSFTGVLALTPDWLPPYRDSFSPSLCGEQGGWGGPYTGVTTSSSCDPMSPAPKPSNLHRGPLCPFWVLETSHLCHTVPAPDPWAIIDSLQNTPTLHCLHPGLHPFGNSSAARPHFAQRGTEGLCHFHRIKSTGPAQKPCAIWQCPPLPTFDHPLSPSLMAPCAPAAPASFTCRAWELLQAWHSHAKPVSPKPAWPCYSSLRSRSQPQFASFATLLPFLMIVLSVYSVQHM